VDYLESALAQCLNLEAVGRVHVRAADLIQSHSLGGKASSRCNVLFQGDRGRVLIARALVWAARLTVRDGPFTRRDSGSMQ